MEEWVGKMNAEMIVWKRVNGNKILSLFLSLFLSFFCRKKGGKK
jgi:hypothetical protein